MDIEREFQGGGWGGRLEDLGGSSGHDDLAPGQSDGNGVYRVGGGVSAPTLIYKTDPEYTEQARAAKYIGTVLLYVEIDPNGDATNIKVQRPLGLGLNEKAIEAVRQWKFEPGQKDGVPVKVRANVEVNFGCNSSPGGPVHA